MEETFRREGNDVCPDQWVRTQDLLKRKLVAVDDFTWKLTSCDLDSGTNERPRYVGGTDISFLKEDPSIACAALVILEIGTLKIVHEEFDLVRLDVPYIPGFLAFREAPILLRILEKMKADGNPFYPQLLMVDGNGVLHPRGFGLACHIGVLANLPTIGVGKNLHHIDGLSREEVRRKLEGPENSDNNILPLIGESGKIWGAALRPGPGSLKPVYISIGHRVSLDSAITLVKMCSKFRVPEPTRQADIRSKAGDNPLNGYPLNDNSKSRARDDGRSDMPDATETVKKGITNIIDTAEAIGENTKKAAETVWESTKEGTDTIKEKLKDSNSEKVPPKEDADAEVAAMESGIDEEWKRRLHRS